MTNPNIDAAIDHVGDTLARAVLNGPGGDLDKHYATLCALGMAAIGLVATKIAEAHSEELERMREDTAEAPARSHPRPAP